MSAFDNATKFFEACDAPLGWVGCEQYVAIDSVFIAQCEPLADIKSIQGYCDWMFGFGTIIAPSAHYELHSASYDENSRTAVFVATYHAKHTGEGGPVPPTNKETHTHYVYAITMNSEDKVEKLVKVWNAPWALGELGWA